MRRRSTAGTPRRPQDPRVGSILRSPLMGSMSCLVFVPRTFKHAEFAGTGQTIHLHPTDWDDGWLITVNPETTDRRRGHDEGADVTARGGLSDLYLLVWNRHSADQLDVLGDKDLLRRWQAAAIV